MIGRIISHYEIIEQIGEGGMGTVYKALDTKLKVHRALKFIHPHLVTDADFKHRFIQEAQAASSLDHPNICGIHQVDETPNGRPFIVMTYYEGVTLAERMKEAPLSAVEVFRTGISIAQGLKCAHDHGIIHRDIKPGNILITEDGYVKILDFGLAKLAGIAGVTKTGVTLGTVRYMSPEQGAGKGADHRSDIWSLGLIMYELATGDFPFKGEFDPAVIYSILNTDPTPAHRVNPDLPESHSRVISHCLDKDPNERYQSAAELINDMIGAAQNEGWGSSFGDLVLPVPASGFGSIAARRRAWRRGLVTAGFLAVAAAALFWWNSRPAGQFTTELRVAVMPLKNKAHPSQELLTKGMWDVVEQMLDHSSRVHDSMWVVPNRLVRYAEIGEDAQARNAFGVNRIVTGNLQRYEGGQVLLLALRDAETLEQTRTVQVPFDPQTNALADSLPGALVRLVELEPASAADWPMYLPRSGLATRHYLEGLGALQEENYSLAIASLGEMVTIEGAFGLGWSFLGWARWLEYSDTGQADILREALSNLEKAVTLEPELWWPLFHLGEVQRKIGNSAEAMAAFKGAMELDPGNPLAGRGLSRVYLDEGREAEGEAVLKSVIERRPDYFEAQRLLALFYFRTKEEGGALRQLDKTLALAPDDLYSLNTKGAVYVDRGEFQSAREMFERAYAFAPNCQTCSNIGWALYDDGKFEESASYYELAMEYCNTADPQPWANWARALYWTEEGPEAAFDPFQMAIDLTWNIWNESPGDPEVIGNLIEYHAMIGDRETTLRLIATADSLSSDNGELLYQMGDAYELIGDRTAALRYLASAMRHGIPAERIQTTRELADLVTDPLFTRMISAESGTE